MKRILPVIMLSFVIGGVATAAQSEELIICRNCEAVVELESRHAERFVEMLMMISSMPLQGTIIGQSSDGSSAEVLVATYEDYARNHNINSFDVAQKIIAFTEMFNIKRITARWWKP